MSEQPPQPTSSQSEPLIPAHFSLPEITLKAVIIAIIITAILGASNAYLALKVGTTIAAAIPAAVMSMAILRLFKKHNVLEINLIQTAASAGEGVAAAVAFVLPGLLIIGYWQHFHYWTMVILVLLGGILGVLISIPLRQVMLNYLNLRFPEGTAVGNVLKASASGRVGVKELFGGGIVGGLITLCQTGFQVVSDNLQFWFVSGKHWLFGNAMGFSPALLAAGYIVGVETAYTLFVGVVIGWVIGIPFLGYWHGLSTGSAYDMAMDLWSHHLRYVGVGTMLVGGVWTLCSLFKPVWRGIVRPLQVMREQKKNKTVFSIPRTERDIPIHYLFWGSLILVVGIYFLLLQSLHAIPFIYPLGKSIYGLSLIGAIYVLIGGFFIASICAYMSGLVGVTNNPLSGLLLISVLLTVLLLFPVFKVAGSLIDPMDLKGAVAIVLIITTLVAVLAVISSENLQDLKAGQMVGATPWKQQVMLLLGVVVSAFLVSPVLELLFQAYGIGGVFPRPGMNQTQMLQAPQASLISAVAKGLFGGNLAWGDVNVGIAVGVLCIIADEYLKRRGRRLAVLAVGLGIYLPPEVLLPVCVGGFLQGLAKRNLKRRLGNDRTAIQHQLEVSSLLACGLVAGSALMGVILAIPFVIEGSADALQLVSSSFKPIADGLGVVSAVLVCVWMYQTSCRIKRPR